MEQLHKKLAFAWYLWVEFELQGAMLTWAGEIIEESGLTPNELDELRWRHYPDTLAV